MTWQHSVPYVPPVVAIDGYPNHDWYGDWSYVVVVVVVCMSLWIPRRGSDVDEGVPWPYGAITNSSDLGGRGWIECVCPLLLLWWWLRFGMDRCLYRWYISLPLSLCYYQYNVSIKYEYVVYCSFNIYDDSYDYCDIRYTRTTRCLLFWFLVRGLQSRRSVL